MAIDGLGPPLAVEGATIARVFETYVERVLAPNGRYRTGKVKPYGKPIASQYPRGRRGDLELMEGEEPFCYARLARGHPAPGRPARGQPARGPPELRPTGLGRPARGRAERGHHARRVEAPVKAKGRRNPATASRNFVATPLAMRRNVLRACAGRSWSAERSAFTFFAIRHRPNSPLCP